MDTVSHVEEVAASLRSNWKFPAVVHFCRVFEGVLSLRQFSSDKFEAALLHPGDHSVFLSELISRLLYPGRKKNALNPETWPTWETNLLKKVKGNWHLTMNHNPLERQQHFVEVSSTEKLEILYLLTEIALQNSATLRDTIRNTVEDPCLTADSVRCLPVGEDSQGNRFFLFSLRYEDCRLYKQTRLLTGEGTSHDDDDESMPQWTTLTTTLEELRSFIGNMKRTKHPTEKKLHRYLVGILPEFERTERHRKKMEDRAALREKAPLLKRSSRLQEQAKRKEKTRGKHRETRDADITDLRNEDGQEEGQNYFDLGISREERMRLRNQRRELAERGLRRVLTGRKRGLEYDGLTPLGASVQCPRKKRIQNVRPSRNITKLVSIIWEKFRRPMHHRTQFEIHIETAKKRRAAMLQNRNDFMARLRLQQRPLEGLGSSIRDVRLPVQDAQRPAYVQQPNIVMNYLQQQQQQQQPLLHQQQRSVRPNTCLSSLMMPRPLQNTSELQTDPQAMLNPALQHFVRYPPRPRDFSGAYVVSPRSLVVPNASGRQMMPQQPRSYELGRSHGIVLPQRPMVHRLHPSVRSDAVVQGIMGSEVNGVSRNVAFPSGYAQRFADSTYARSVHSFGQQHQHQHQESARNVTPALNGISGYPTHYRNVRPQSMPNRLTPTLVHLPSWQTTLKAQWNTPHSGGSTNGGGEIPKMPYGPPFLAQNPGQLRSDILRPTIARPYSYDNGARWQASSQIRDNGNHPGPLSSVVLKRKREGC